MDFKRFKISKKLDTLLTFILVLANLIMINVVCSRLYFNIDLTKDRMFSLSGHTDKIVRQLREPLEVAAQHRARQALEQAHHLAAAHHLDAAHPLEPPVARPG